MRCIVCVLPLLALACGTPQEEASPPPPAETPAAEPAPAPPPPPPPAPEPVADCPTDAWSVAANGAPNRGTEQGVEAAGWARSMGSGWERLRVCRTIDDFEVRLSCAPIPRGAECSLSLPTEACTATLPGPTLPIAVGQLVDTQAKPSEGTWQCVHRR